MNSQYSDSGVYAVLAGIGIVYYIVLLAISVIVIIAMWKLYDKAGEPGWASIIPFYNNYVLFKIVYGEGWKFLLVLVPILGSILGIAVYARLAGAFGKGTGYAVGLVFLPVIFLPLLAFDSNTYYYGPTNSFI